MRRKAFFAIALGLVACGGSDASPGSSGSDEQGSATASCMRRCVDNNDGCALEDPAEFPTLAETQTAWQAKCSAQRSFLVRGSCADGSQVLVYSTGYNGERRIFSPDGAFSSLVAFTDTGSSPCYGQGFWPAFPKCEMPTVSETLCGQAVEAGEPMILWLEL